jgi:hypothetical protein
MCGSPTLLNERAKRPSALGQKDDAGKQFPAQTEWSQNAF